MGDLSDSLRSEMISKQADRARRAKPVFENFKRAEGCHPTAARIALVLAMIETCESEDEFDAYRNEVMMIFAAQAVLRDKLDGNNSERADD